MGPSCLDISDVCLFVFSKQTQNAVNKSEVSNGSTQFEAPSAFKGNQRINNTMVFSSRLQFQVIVCNLCCFKRGAGAAGVGGGVGWGGGLTVGSAGIGCFSG